MNNQSYLNFDRSFIFELRKANKEVERLKLKKISSTIFFYTLYNSEQSYLREFLKDIGVNLKSAEKIITNLISNYAKKNKHEKAPESAFIVDEFMFPVSAEFFDIVYDAPIYSEDGFDVSEETFICSLLAGDIPEDILMFLDNIKVDLLTLKRYYLGIIKEKSELLEQEKSKEDDNKSVINISIPEELKHCLSFFEGDSKILDREKETENLIRILLKSKKKNAILIGEPGVGKTAIVESLAYKITKGDCYNELRNKRIICVELNSLIAGTKYRGEAEEKFVRLAEFLESTTDVILFIDEIHTIIGAGAGSESSLDLANSLKPLLARKDISIIGATTTEEYEKYFSKDRAIKRRFEVVQVKEPEFEKIPSMIRLQVNNLKKFHKVEIMPDIIDFIIMMASCFNSETANPDRTIDLIDRSMVAAKMKGEKTVTKAIVLSNFEANYELYNKMSYELKMSTAYHEAGHALVRLYSKYLGKQKILAVSIIPTENYLGITSWNAFENNLINWDYNAFIDEIATYLAGRVAEEMYTKSYTAGASADLKKATYKAKTMLVEMGFQPEFTKRNFEDDMDEDSMKEFNSRLEKIIDEAFDRAKILLRTHESTLKKVATELVDKGIITGLELEKICADNEKEIIKI